MRIDEVISARIEDVYRNIKPWYDDGYYHYSDGIPNQFIYKGDKYTLEKIRTIDWYENEKYYNVYYYQLAKNGERLPYYWKEEWRGYHDYVWCPNANDEVGKIISFHKKPVQITEEETM